MFSRLPCTPGLRSDSDSISDIGAAEAGMAAIIGTVGALGVAATIGEAGIGSAVGTGGVDFTTIGNEKACSVLVVWRG